MSNWAVSSCALQVLVRQINVSVHIPDFVFAFGDEAVKDTFQFFILMPALIISAKLSPANVEGSMYALVTMTSNLSGVSVAHFLVGARQALSEPSSHMILT